jgi:NAD(P)-dependent dehydrogenase (short-subunit alcohol dehydrogenase family)
MAKVIFITGASRGFGKVWTEAFLQRGDKVVAAARNPDTLKELVKQYGDSIYPIALDVNNREQCFSAIDAARKRFGGIDVLINNAGYGLFGAIEEVSEQEARDQIETNLFGLLWITQAAIPVMRAQGSGHIIQISSVLGQVALPILGIYNASKAAVEALSESLALEVAGLGIKITLVEPNTFGTDWIGASAVRSKGIPVYDEVKADLFSRVTEDTIGIPEATSEAILRVVDDANPPLRLTLGKMAYPWIKQVYEGRLATWEAWKDISTAAHGK